MHTEIVWIKATRCQGITCEGSRVLVWGCCLALLLLSQPSTHSTSCQQGGSSVLPGSRSQGSSGEARSGGAVGQAGQWWQSLARTVSRQKGHDPCGAQAMSSRSGESFLPSSFSPSIMKGAEMAAADTGVCSTHTPPTTSCPVLGSLVAVMHRMTHHPTVTHHRGTGHSGCAALRTETQHLKDVFKRFLALRLSKITTCTE